MNRHYTQLWGRGGLLLLLLISGFQLLAQTAYIGPANGDWFTPSNWNNGLPASGNNALITGGAAVTINGPLTVNFSIDSYGTITNNSTITVSGTLINESIGTLVNNGSIVNNQTFNNYGSLTNKGTLSNKQTFYSNGTVNNLSLGNITNEGSFTCQGAITNFGSLTNKSLLSSSNLLDNSGILTNEITGNLGNNFGATLKNNAGATLINAGNLQSDAVISNAGTTQNMGTLRSNGNMQNTGTVNNNNGAQYQNYGTFDNNNAFTNVSGGTVLNAYLINNYGTFVNNYLFSNAATIDNKAAAVFTNETGGEITCQYGSAILNAGSFTNKNKITSNAAITNNKTFNNNGVIESNNGGNIVNNDQFTNNNAIRNVNAISNYGTFTNNGTLDNNSGGTIANYATLLNSPTGRMTNNFEIYVNSGSMLTNNGFLGNGVRLYINGTLTNNAYIQDAGDIFNNTGGVLNNTEVIELSSGTLLNNGTLNNSKRLIISKCSSLANKSNISNTGKIENSGIVFQTGTLTGNAITNLNGYVHTSTLSNAPICRNITVSTDVNGDAKVYAQALVNLPAAELCANLIYLANGQARPLYACSDIGTIKTIPVVVKDRLGDSLTCSSLVTIVDSLAPVFTSCPENLSVFTPSTTANVSWTAPTATDNCSTATVTSSHTPGASFPLGLTAVTYSAKDGQNNTNTCQFKITVYQVDGVSNCTNDNTPPVFAGCPANINLNSLTGGPVNAIWAPPVASDNCFPMTVISNYQPYAPFPVGTTAVVYTAKDGSGNQSSCTFNVTVSATDPCAYDLAAPVFTSCPVNIFSLTNTAINGAIGIWNAPSATDNCPNLQLSGNYASGSFFPVGATTVTYLAKDAAGNTSSCNFVVTVAATDPCPTDVSGPVFSGCPANLNLTTTSASAPGTWTAPTATDNCSGVTINSNYKPGYPFPLGSTTVSYTASDKKGNSSICSFIVTVVNPCQSDTTRPIINNCPSVVNAIATSTNTPVTWTAPTATDNCGNVTLTSNYQPGNTFPIGTTSVIYTATDNLGNISNCQFNVVVTGSVGNVCSNVLSIRDVTSTAFNCGAGTAYALYYNGQGWAASKDVKFIEYNDGTALLTGTYFNCNNTAFLKVQFAGKTVAPPTGSPKLQLCTSSAAADWYYYTNISGSISFNNGTVVSITRRGPAFQVGTGANLQDNNKYGASGWFLTNTNIEGDLNFRLGATKGCNEPCVTQTGGAVVEKYCSINGSDLANLYSCSAFPGNPCTTYSINTFQSPVNAADNYGSRVRAYIVPAVTGAYTFILTGDDDSELYLSTDGNPFNKTKIAFVDGWTGLTEFNKYPSQTSASITLQAGVRYYVELTQKEGTGGDFFAVYWKTPSSTTPTIIPGSSLAPYQEGCVPTPPNTPTSCDVVDINSNGIKTLFLNGIPNDASDYYKESGSGMTFTQNADGTASLKGVVENVSNANQKWEIDFKFINKRNYNDWIATGHMAVVSGCPTPAPETWSYFEFGTCVLRGQGAYANVVLNVVPFDVAKGVQVGDKGADFYDCNFGLGTWFNFTGAYTGGGDLNVNLNCSINNNTCIPSGGLKREYWLNVPGSTITSLTNSCSTYPNNPSGTTTITSFKGITSFGDNYGERITGYLVPSVTGQYTFTITGDDYTELYLSSNSSSSGKVKIAYINGYTDEGQLNKYTSQTSVAITLQAGNYYYVELLHKEATGADHFAVYWKTPTNQTATIIPGANLSITGCSVADPCPAVPGGISREYWSCNPTWTSPVTIGGGFPNNPTGTSTLTTFQGPSGFGDNYSTRVRGYIIPSVSGAYTFCETGDDYVDLYLSTDNNPSNKQRICYHVGYTNPTEYTKYLTQTSSTINLIAGQKYYVELMHQEGTGGDHFQVYWKTPASSVWTIIPGQNIAPFTNCTQNTNTCNKNILFVTGTNPCGNGDALIKTRLESLGYTVTVIDHNSVKTSDANGMGLVIISSTTASLNIGTKFRDVTIPVLSWEAWLFDDMGMTGTVEYTDYGDLSNINKTQMVNNTHPIGVGLTGTVNVFTNGQLIRWGKPASGATIISQVPLCPTKAMVFAYETGSQMVGLNAPARRIGFFLNDDLPSVLNSNGWLLFDNAIRWATGCSATIGLVAEPTVLEMNAQRQPDQIRLEWINNTGLKNDHFEVEKLNANGDFVTLDNVDATASDNASRYYTTYDKNPLDGDNYYRLKLVYANGNEQYTDVLKIEFTRNSDFGIFPNPAGESVSLDLSTYEGLPVQVVFFNSLGQPVITKQIQEASANPETFDLHNLISGRYLVRIQTEGKKSLTKQLIITK